MVQLLYTVNLHLRRAVARHNEKPLEVRPLHDAIGPLCCRCGPLGPKGQYCCRAEHQLWRSGLLLNLFVFGPRSLSYNRLYLYFRSPAC